MNQTSPTHFNKTLRSIGRQVTEAATSPCCENNRGLSCQFSGPPARESNQKSLTNDGNSMVGAVDQYGFGVAPLIVKFLTCPNYGRNS